MWITLECPGCQKPDLIEVRPESVKLSCPNCSWSRPIAEANHGDNEPASCLVCGCDDLWRQKDFPPRLGILVVGTEVVLSTIFWSYMALAWYFGVLLAFAFMDLVLYSVMPDVLVCYRCHARHRGTALVGRNERFNLETHERYRQEAIRLKEATSAK